MVQVDSLIVMPHGLVLVLREQQPFVLILNLSAERVMIDLIGAKKFVLIILYPRPKNIIMGNAPSEI